MLVKLKKKGCNDDDDNDATEDGIDNENILVIHNPKYEKILKKMKSIFPNLKL